MLKEHWASFEREIIPREAGAVQREEMRRAFYAGAQACYTGILRMLEPGTEPTENDLLKMAALHAELQQFVKSL